MGDRTKVHAITGDADPCRIQISDNLISTTDAAQHMCWSEREANEVGLWRHHCHVFESGQGTPKRRRALMIIGES